MVYIDYASLNAENFPKGDAAFQTFHLVAFYPEFYTAPNFIPRLLMNRKNYGQSSIICESEIICVGETPQGFSRARSFGLCSGV